MNVQPKSPRPPLNGVDTPTLINTINFVAGQPDLAKFQFRAANEWIEGTHSRTSMQRLLRRRWRAEARRRPILPTATTRPCCAAAIARRRPSNGCCTRSRPA